MSLKFEYHPVFERDNDVFFFFVYFADKIIGELKVYNFNLFALPKIVFEPTQKVGAKNIGIIFDYPAELEKSAPQSYFHYFEKQLFEFCGGFYQMLYEGGKNGNF